MQQAEYHHTNSLAQTILEDIQQTLQSRYAEIMAMVQSIPNLLQVLSTSEDSQSKSKEQVVNSIITELSVQLEILRLLKQIQKEIKLNY